MAGRQRREPLLLSGNALCSVYGTSNHGDQSFVAMQFLDGVTVRHLIAARTVELETILPIAIQISDGLDASREESIVHRAHQHLARRSSWPRPEDQTKR